MIIPLLLVSFGLIGLWLSGELVVRYSLQLAYIAGISTLFIGFFFVSVSTGLPELFVVFNATWLKTPALAVGDIMGSNFFDLAMGLGIPAFFIRAILIPKKELAQTIAMLISSALLILFIFAHQQFHFWHGIALISTYAAINLFSMKLRSESNLHEENMPHVKATLQKEFVLTSARGTAFKLFCSVILLLITSHFTVTYAIKLALTLGWPITLFGATFIALGTSLPELTLSLTAIKNKEYALALGNAFGSIWDQGALMLGLLIILNKQTINLSPIRHLLPFALTAFAIVGFAIVQKKRIGKTAGFLLIATYFTFILYEFVGLSR